MVCPAGNRSCCISRARMAITTEWHWLCAMTKLSARDAAWHAGDDLNVCGAIDGVRGLNSASCFRARSYLRLPCWCVFRPLAEIGDISSPERGRPGRSYSEAVPARGLGAWPNIARVANQEKG